ncbi:MAG: 50S ribosomal protein L10 [Clostridia bacterium]|nr:50S ribosomal protein L10 [Clostridia bacterium]
MPNAKVLEQKKATVASLVEKIQNAAGGVIVDYKGISVADDTALRRKLREAGVEYAVVKNTLLRFAFDNTGLGDLDPQLNGSTAIAIASDAVAAAKILSEYSTKTKEAFKIKGGFVDGKVIDKEGVKALAELPSKEVLIATVLAGFNAPITGFVNVLNGNIRGLAAALKAIADKKSEEAA